MIVSKGKKRCVRLRERKTLPRTQMHSRSFMKCLQTLKRIFEMRKSPKRISEMHRSPKHKLEMRNKELSQN